MFIWDSGNIEHINRHGVLPEEAEQVLENNPIDLRHHERNGEQRILHVGETITGRVLLVVVTLRGEDLRVVTAWPANKKEREFYSVNKKDGDKYV